MLLLLWRRTLTTSPSLQHEKSVLIVTAHPDDECMFFGPVIVSLVNSGIKVHILCLSTGNWYGKGAVRDDEFYSSCQTLGVGASNCSVVNDSELPDEPTVEWNEARVREHVEYHVRKWNVSALLTFDEQGVSGHVNHISVYRVMENYRYPGLSLYKLLTVNIFRKYLSFFDIFISHFCKENIYISPYDALAKPFAAMFHHRSQLMWFRYLYMMFSRYMLVNSVEPIYQA